MTARKDSKDNPGLSFYDRMVAEALEQLPSGRIVDEKGRSLQRSLERAILPRKVKKLEEQVRKMQKLHGEPALPGLPEDAQKRSTKVVRGELSMQIIKEVKFLKNPPHAPSSAQISRH